MHHDDRSLLDALPLFQALSPDTRRRLIDAGRIQAYAAGATMFVAGSMAAGLFVVLSGHVRVVRSHEGRVQVVHHEGPGGTLGEVPFFADGVLPATAVASEATRCLVLNADALQRVMAADPALAALFLRRLARRVRELVERLDRGSSQPVVARLAAFLDARARAAPADAFTLGMSQGELAEELGTAREVIVRSLSQLRRSAVIASAGRGRFRVLDAQRLKALSTPST